MYNIILGYITAFTLTFFAIPSIIKIAKAKHLYDEPGERRVHKENTPSLGGIAIFAGLIFSIVLWTPFKEFSALQYIICAFLIIFLIGAKDDIIPLDPSKKLIGQLMAAMILIFKSDIRLTSFYGMFGIYEISDWLSIVLTIFTFIVIMNSLNLIDGINGLAGSISLIVCLVFGTWFFLIDRIELAIVAYATAGAVTAFLRYNLATAQIFMGDTGSLLLGLVGAILAIEFIEANLTLEQQPYAIHAAPAVAFGVLIIPLFDTLRVFTTRMLRGRSPFRADRNHIHHLLLDMGFSHSSATACLAIVNILMVVLVFELGYWPTLHLFLLILGIAGLLSGSLFYLVVKKRRQLQ